jgi:pimeloyl-ACP methyl ester carboxylesterase
VTYRDLYTDVRGPTDGESLLLLHGWGSSSEHMRPVADALENRYRCHLVDLPGHGQSPPPPEPWGVPEHAECLTEYIQQEIKTKATLVGHSNGGRLSLYLASQSATAGLVRRLILISPSGVRPERSWATRARAGVATALKTPVQALPEPVRTPAMDWLRHSAVWKLLGSSDYNAASGVMRETFVKTVNYHLDDALDRISAPALLFWGTGDEAVPRRQIEILEERIPDCGLVELPGAGHYGHLDQFDTFISAVRYFLENS